MERDLKTYGQVRACISISTHTLTWSVTSTVPISGNVYGISTHTLTWSVTKNSLVTLTKKSISTHTLTWSVTRLTSPL